MYKYYIDLLSVATYISPEAETYFEEESWEKILAKAKEIFIFPEQYYVELPGYPKLTKAQELIEHEDEDDEDDWEI